MTLASRRTFVTGLAASSLASAVTLVQSETYLGDHPFVGLTVETFMDCAGERELLWSSFNEGNGKFLPSLLGNIAPVRIEQRAILEFEFDSEISHSGQYYAGFYDAEDKFLVELPDFRFRVWHNKVPPGTTGIVDRYGPCEAPAGATGVMVGITYNPERDPKLSKSARIYLRHAVRTTQPPQHTVVLSSSFTVDHEAVGDVKKTLLRRGTVWELKDVREAYILRADHSVRQINTGASCLIGSFGYHSIGIQRMDGSYWRLDVSGAETIVVQKQNYAGALRIEARLYDFAERTTLVEGVFEALPDKTALRVNPNLGVAYGHDGGALTISAVKSSHFIEMLWQPQGRLATLIVTEHADYQEAETERLFTYGNAAGNLKQGSGLAGYQIPYTKTIFVGGKPVDFVKRMPNGLSVPFRQASYQGSPEFRQIINRYKTEGLPIEIGLHTFSTDPLVSADIIAESLEGLGHLNMRVWTDHGSVLTNIMRRGWDATEKEFFVAEVLSKNGFDRFWVDGDILPNSEVYGNISLIRDDQHCGILYDLPTLWPTQRKNRVFRTLVTPSLDRFTTADQLGRLIQNRGISIFHLYFAYSAIDYSINEGVRYAELKPWFDQALQEIDELRRSGFLYVATIGQWSDYVESVRVVHKIPDGEDLRLRAEKPVTDLSLAVIPFGHYAKEMKLLQDGRVVHPSRTIQQNNYFSINFDRDTKIQLTF